MTGGVTRGGRDEETCQVSDLDENEQCGDPDP